jgi:hypothetical protein
MRDNIGKTSELTGSRNGHASLCDLRSRCAIKNKETGSQRYKIEIQQRETTDTNKIHLKEERHDYERGKKGIVASMDTLLEPCLESLVSFVERGV